mgnify:FL=1
MDVCRLFVLCGGEVSAVSAFVLPFLCGLGAAVISAWGVGGGTLLLLVMTLFLGVDQRTAQGINLLFFLPTALSALLCHRKNGCFYLSCFLSENIPANTSINTVFTDLSILHKTRHLASDRLRHSDWHRKVPLNTFQLYPAFPVL